jgi:organic hydroperoxide reductase OsmC/OhrA
MDISATVWNSPDEGHQVVVRTDGVAHTLVVPKKAAGRGSAVNGGEFLMLALATCYCNDLWREAAQLGLQLDAVEIEASATFAGPGLAASEVRYRAWISSPEPQGAIDELLRVTDAVAEVHNTLRAGVEVTRISD